jgi:hypothetical protein
MSIRGKALLLTGAIFLAGATPTLAQGTATPTATDTIKDDPERSG